MDNSGHIWRRFRVTVGMADLAVKFVFGATFEARDFLPSLIS